MPSRHAGLAAIAALALTLTGCSAGAVAGHDKAVPTSSEAATSQHPWAVDGLTPQAVAVAVASGTAWMDPTVLIAAHGTDAGTRGRPGITLDIRVAGADSADGGFLPSTWQADLAQGVIAERLVGDSGNLADAIAEVHIEFVDAAGKATKIRGGVGDVPAGQRFGDPATTDAQAEAALRARATAYGVTVREARILHPLDRAAYVIVRLPEIGSLDGKFEALRQALLGEPRTFEGLYLEVQGPDGRPLVRGSVAFRSGAGRLWLEPTYDARSGAVHGGPPLPVTDASTTAGSSDPSRLIRR